MDFPVRAPWALVLLGAVSCSSPSGGGGPAASADGGGDPPGVFAPGGDGGEAPREGAVYANSQRSLYRFEPLTGRFDKVGDFDCVEFVAEGASQQGMADIAVGADGAMFGVGLGAGGFGLMRIDQATGRCTVHGPPIDETSITSLSFVPVGTLDPTVEALVATTLDGWYYRIDLASGEMVRLGQTDVFTRSKGNDLVSIRGAGTFATAGEPHHLFRIDEATGAILEDVGDLGLGADMVTGLACWAGTLYGFTFEGRVLAIDPATAATTPIDAPDAPPSFWGAGVETTAPLVRPK